MALMIININRIHCLATVKVGNLMSINTEVVKKILLKSKPLNHGGNRGKITGLLDSTGSPLGRKQRSIQNFTMSHSTISDIRIMVVIKSQVCVPQNCFYHCGLTDKDRHGLTTCTNTSTGHRRHLHLVEHTWHQTS